MTTYDYVIEVVADVPAKEAFLKYIDVHSMKNWQPNLIRIEREKGLLFQQGSSGYLVYQNGDQEMRMQVDVNLCSGHLFDATYQVKGIVNRCVNQFTKKEGKLLWQMTVRFEFEHDDIPEQSVFETTTRQSMLQFIHYLEQEK